MTDSLGEAFSPLQNLLDMLDPDKKQWLQSQTPEKQEQLAKDFMNSGGGVTAVDTDKQNFLQNDVMGGGDARANQFIRLAQMSR
ncbi:hypothetical protein AB0I16_30445 [Streptomyces sp. NPDC050703]|uniref:hypothetical protein n=1 Tax=Streptomyces sp. NPDC050703 TaxID=3157218 RepID=UPI003445F65A